MSGRIPRDPVEAMAEQMLELIIQWRGQDWVSNTLTVMADLPSALKVWNPNEMEEVEDVLKTALKHAFEWQEHSTPDDTVHSTTFIHRIVGETLSRLVYESCETNIRGRGGDA